MFQLTSLTCNDTTFDLGQSKLGVTTRDYDVTVQDNFGTASESAPVHSGNHWLVGLSTRERAKAVEIMRQALLFVGGPSLLVFVPPSRKE